KTAASSADAAGVLEKAEEVNGVKLVVHQFSNMDGKALRDAYDAMKSRRPEKLFVLLASSVDGKAAMIAGASKDVAKAVSAGDIVRVAAQAAGGSGGGKPEMAQAGAKDPSKLAEALKAGEQAAREKLLQS